MRGAARGHGRGSVEMNARLNPCAPAHGLAMSIR